MTPQSDPQTATVVTVAMMVLLPLLVVLVVVCSLPFEWMRVLTHTRVRVFRRNRREGTART
jgi:hypothetical protein